MPSISQPTTHGSSISVYQDQLSIPQAIEQFKKLKMAFPQLPAGFYDILLDRIKENGFTDKRLNDAINNLIDSFHYPNPTVANIVGFDKRVKLITYSQLCDLENGCPGSFKDHCKVRVKGKVLWINRAEKEKYNIGDEL